MNDIADSLKVSQLIELLNELKMYPDMDGDLHSIVTGDGIQYNGSSGWRLFPWRT